MLKHDVATVHEDRHTFTLDEAEIVGMVKGVAMRALKVGADDPNVVVGTPNIQVIDGSVAAVLVVTVKHDDVVEAPESEASDVTPDAEPVSDGPAGPADEQADLVSAPALAPVPAPLGVAPAVVAVPGWVPGMNKAA